MGLVGFLFELSVVGFRLSCPVFDGQSVTSAPNPLSLTRALFFGVLL